MPIGLPGSQPDSPVFHKKILGIPAGATERSSPRELADREFQAGWYEGIHTLASVQGTFWTLAIGFLARSGCAGASRIESGNGVLDSPVVAR